MEKVGGRVAGPIAGVGVVPIPIAGEYGAMMTYGADTKAEETDARDADTEA